MPPRRWTPRPPQPQRRETLITDVEPLLALKFYAEAIVMARRVGRRWSEYVVDEAAVRQVLAGTPVSSGLLAPHTLATGVMDGLPFFVTLVPPRRVAVGTRSGAWDRVHTWVTPPLVWAGWHQQYRVYALHRTNLRRGWPTSATIPLYLAPFANTYQSGDICWGTGPRPGPADLSTMAASFGLYAEESFFLETASAAPSRAFRGDIPALYDSLRGRRVYPCDDLVAQGKTLAHVISGDAFRGTTTA